MIGPRQLRTTWDQHNMLMAMVAATRSPDPNTQVGAYICTPDNKPIASGYNGVAKGIDPETIPWDRTGDSPEKTKYAYVVHAELNAILNAKGLTQETKLYSTLFPCNECAKAIIQAGIQEVIFMENLYPDQWFTKLASSFFTTTNILVRQLTPDCNLEIDL